MKCGGVTRLSDRRGQYTIMIHCYPCKRTVSKNPAEFLARYGDIQLIEIREKLRCAQCGERRYLALWTDDEPPK